MRKPWILRLTPLLLLLGLTLTLSGTETSPSPAQTAASACSVAAASGVPGELGGPLVPLCQPTNEDGCSFSDIACAGFHCCCIYACPDGSVSPGPCFQL